MAKRSDFEGKPSSIPGRPIDEIAQGPHVAVTKLPPASADRYGRAKTGPRNLQDMTKAGRSGGAVPKLKAQARAGAMLRLSRVMRNR